MSDKVLTTRPLCLPYLGWCYNGGGTNEETSRERSVLVTKTVFEQPALAAKRWRAFFENTSVGIVITDERRRFVAANAAFQQMLGYSAEELGKLTYLDLTFEDDREANQAITQGLAAGTRQSMQMEKRYRRKNGEIIWVNVGGNVIPGAPEGSMYLAAIVQDITERKRAEDALREAQAELAHITRVTTLGELAASIAHEINQPLGAIVADASACLNWLAAEQPDLGSVREALRAIVSDGERAANVLTRIRKLLTRDRVAQEACDVAGVVRDVLALVDTDLAREAVCVRTVLAEDLPPVVADRIQLQQVLLNLLLNAAEASKPLTAERRRVLVRAGLEDLDDGPYVVVAVEDAGVGLPPSGADRLFEPFHTTKPNGLGMGLSISRSIIDLHGGRLWASANAGHGATFQFALPLLR
jgi:PAS domain S-box-containing protein